MVSIAAKGVLRLAWLTLIVCALNGAPSASPALAQSVGMEQPRSQQPKTIPLPPPRPPELGGKQAPAPQLRPPPAAPQAEQARPATPDASTTQDASTRQDTPTGLTPPAQEPAYDRRAMRACGEEWQAMKRAGAASGKVWRDFAAQCLRRKAPK